MCAPSNVQFQLKKGSMLQCGARRKSVFVCATERRLGCGGRPHLAKMPAECVVRLESRLGPRSDLPTPSTSLASHSGPQLPSQVKSSWDCYSVLFCPVMTQPNNPLSGKRIGPIDRLAPLSFVEFLYHRSEDELLHYCTSVDA